MKVEKKESWVEMEEVKKKEDENEAEEPMVMKKMDEQKEKDWEQEME